MASHGDKENLNTFTLLNKDYDRVIAHNIQKNSFDEGKKIAGKSSINYKHANISALEIMKKHGKKEHFYQFTPAMMQAIPRKMVQALISQGRNLSPAKLIPALVLYDQGESDPQASETVRYLEYCVQELQCKDQAIHNYLLALYARLNPEKLMQYLAIQGRQL